MAVTNFWSLQPGEAIFADELQKRFKDELAIYSDAVLGGNATSPVFSTLSLGKKYCLTHIATYHWNGGEGDTSAGTFKLADSGGKLVGGPWTVYQTAATGGVLATGKPIYHTVRAL